jgi:hypothetical protein
MTLPALVRTRSSPAIPAGSVFISYARLDDEKPPGREDVQGWVSFFWGELRYELTNAGLGQAKLWLDRYEIEKAEKFTDKIEAALAEAKVILPVLSPNWLGRDWCVQEVLRFAEQKVQGRDLANDILPVFKIEIPPTEPIPAPLLGREGYQFFRRDQAGHLSEFYWRGLKNEKDYLDLVREIAFRIRDRFFVPPEEQVDIKPSRGRTVFVAVPTDELRDAWQRLVNDLKSDGYTVLPADDRLPDTAAKAEELVRTALEQAELALHIFGESEGVIPCGGTEGIVRLQLRLSRAHASADRSRRRILWAPRWLPDANSGKRDPFEVIGRFGPLTDGEHVYAEAVTELSQWLRDALNVPVAEAVSATSSWYIAGACAADDPHVSLLANALQSAGQDVEAVFSSDPVPHQLQDRSTTVVLLPWGETDVASLIARLAALEPLGRRVVLCLPGGDVAVKNCFFRKGIVVLPMPVLPADSAATTALLDRLKVVQGQPR